MLDLPEDALAERFLAASGPGGQNVNKVATAVQQGAQSFRCVRVTDGSETAANYAISYANGNYPVLLTARYAGSLGNSVGITLGAGSAAGTWRLTLGIAGQVAENFDKLAAPTPPAFWQNLVNAVNQGIGALRGPSQLCVASLGQGTGTAPTRSGTRRSCHAGGRRAGLSVATPRVTTRRGHEGRGRGGWRGRHGGSGRTRRSSATPPRGRSA